MAYFLGIDLGLSGARAAVLDDRGKLVGAGRVRSTVAERDRAEQDPEKWLETIARAVEEALSAAGRPTLAAIGVGAFGPCMVTLDERMRPTGPASIFAFDTRHEPWRLGLLRQGRSDDELGADHVLPKIMRLRETDSDRFARTAFALDATGFVVASLTGVPVMDPVTQLDHLVDGVPTPRQVPAAMQADTIAGHVTQNAAGRFGIAPGTPVCVGSYDSYVDLFGAGVVRDGDAGILLGSTAVICRICDHFSELGPLRATPFIGEGQMVGGWTSAAGSLLAWADDVTAGGKEAIASGHPGDTGLIMLPYFAGERAPIWDSRARGALLGLTLATTGRHIRQSAIEAVALSIMDIVSHLDSACGRTERFRVAGGGASIPALTRAIASATGRPLDVVAHPGEACAPAILAARAVGTGIDRPIAETVLPDPTAHGQYAELIEIYRPLYGQLAGAMHKLGEIAERRKSG